MDFKEWIIMDFKDFDFKKKSIMDLKEKDFKKKAQMDFGEKDFKEIDFKKKNSNGLWGNSPKGNWF